MRRAQKHFFWDYWAWIIQYGQEKKLGEKSDSEKRIGNEKYLKILNEPPRR